jgi:predicted secreted Zn-dependent protease
MRPWFALLLLLVLVSGCGRLEAQSAFETPPRDELLQPLFSNTDILEGIRIQESAWLRTYPVSSEGGLESIRRQLDRLGPISDDSGKRFDGLTTWALRWSFNYDETGGECRVRNATIEVEAVITLPELQGAELLAPEEFNLWQAYHDKLTAHEDGHVNIYLTAARDLRDQVLKIGAMPTCRTLANLLGEHGEAMIETVRYNDQLYDERTGHGAAFP